jgi:site-specific DNA-methyltransferase (adenine-specific)
MRHVRADELPPGAPDDDLVVEGENLTALARLPDELFDVVYIDPPFNTGRTQRRRAIAVRRDDDGGDRTGFGGRRYRTELLSDMAFGDDAHGDYLAFLAPRLEEAHRLLAPHGTLYFHIDYREAHYCKVLLDRVFGRESFLNEIIWAYDYGARSTRRWPAKHDTILVYVKDPARYHFDSAEVDREPYMAPGLVTAEKAARGKLPSDCYSDDTEVLARRGWSYFEDLTEEDELATVTADGELVYDRPVKLHAYDYTGPMVHFEGKVVDLLVTPNHSMYLKPKRGSDFEFVPAEDVDGAPSHYFSLLKRLRWRGESPPLRHSVPPVDYERSYCAKPLPDFDPGDWCEFMGWYLAEGSFTFYRDRCEVAIAQSRDPERIERLRALLDRMGLHARNDGRSFVVANKQLCTYLSRFGKARDKHVPRELLRLAPEYLERLYEGLMLGDGSRRVRTAAEEAVYVTTSPQLADDVQEVLLKLGFGASITYQWSRNPGWSPRYVVSRHSSRESTIWPTRHRRTRDYSGKVYCATVVPTHTVIVRRGGVAAVCGNCWWHTIVPTNGAERTGYPTQKPEGIVRRMVTASSRPGGWCLDFFAGSGTLGAVCRGLGRRYVLVDSNPEAVEVMLRRLGAAEG